MVGLSVSGGAGGGGNRGSGPAFQDLGFQKINGLFQALVDLIQVFRVGDYSGGPPVSGPAHPGDGFPGMNQSLAAYRIDVNIKTLVSGFHADIHQVLPGNIQGGIFLLVDRSHHQFDHVVIKKIIKLHAGGLSLNQPLHQHRRSDFLLHQIAAEKSLIMNFLLIKIHQALLVNALHITRFPAAKDRSESLFLVALSQGSGLLFQFVAVEGGQRKEDVRQGDLGKHVFLGHFTDFLNGRGIKPDDVATLRQKEDRLVGKALIVQNRSRLFRRFPLQQFFPESIGEINVGLRISFNIALQFLQNFIQGEGIGKVQAAGAEDLQGGMSRRVDQAGNQEVPFQIHHHRFLPFQFQNRFRIAYCRYAAVGAGHRLNDRLIRVQSINRTVVKNRIGSCGFLLKKSKCHSFPSVENQRK